MSKYRRLDFSKLNFSDEVITYDEALKNATPFELSSIPVQKTNLSELRSRAKRRKMLFSTESKSDNDIMVENDLFKALENQIYEQIARK